MHVTLHALDFGDLHVGQQFVVPPHHVVRDGHQLAVHFERRLFDSDCVAVRLRHLLHTIESFEDRHCQDDLRFLSVGALQFAADEKIELLVGATELDIGLQHDGIVSLRNRVQQLVQRNRLFVLEAVVKVFTLKHL